MVELTLLEDFYFQNVPYLKLISLLKELNLLSAEVLAFVLSPIVFGFYITPSLKGAQSGI